MYGIINNTIKDLVIHKFGEEEWEAVLENSDLDIDFFISNETYDDSITYKLVESIVSRTQIPVTDLMETLGEWWVTNVSKEKYGALMESGGATMQEFLKHLPIFHNRVMLIYPKINAPEFRVSNLEENSLHIHYYSNREGFKHFVLGILYGLGKMYKTSVEVDVLQSREDGSDHEVYKVTW